MLENPSVIKTPVVRNGKLSTPGYQPRYGRSGNRKLGRKHERMTYYDQEKPVLRQQLQKEIPILTALIQKLYQDLDRKFHLNGAKIPVTFGFETDSLGSCEGERVLMEKEHFHFSLPFVAYGVTNYVVKKRTVSIYSSMNTALHAVQYADTWEV